MFRDISAPKTGIQTNFSGEKQTMRAFKKILSYCTPIVLVLMFNLSATAQAVYHSGQTIRISVTFEGPDAGKIAQATMNWDTPTVPTNQPGFSQQMYSGEARQT